MPASPTLTPAPRAVPRRLRLQLHVGGYLRQAMWLILLIGAAIAAVFVPPADLGSHHYDRTSLGVIERVESTSASRNKRPIQEVVARFEDERGQTRSVTSYGLSPPPVGAEVVVHYDAARPDDAVIDGLEPALIGRWVLLTLLLPGFAGVVLLTRIRESRRAVHLLAHGRTTEGTIVGRRRGRLRINKRAETRLTFEYEVEGGARHRCEIGTFQPAVLEDQPTEAMLYDPQRPERATTLDHLPGNPTICGDGTIGSRGGVARLLALPSLAIAALLVLVVRTLLG